MYGWMYECLKSMIITRYDLEVWKEIIQRSHFDQDSWGIQEYTPDSTYFTLVQITADVLGIHESQVRKMSSSLTHTLSLSLSLSLLFSLSDFLSGL